MVEGVIVLPFLIVILAAVLHFHKSFSAKLEGSERARSCAWEYSLAGCKGFASLPKGCNVKRLTDGADALSGIGADPTIGAEANKAFGKSSGGDAIAGGLAGTNRMGLALLGLREGVTARHSKDVVAPSLLGGGTRAISANYSVMCNEVEMGALEIAKSAYCALGSDGPMPGCEDG